jgi:hypothetical protein
MATRQQPTTRKQSRSKRDEPEADSDTGTNGHDDEVASYEQELADYLQERIRPGLNRGSIPLLARSIAKEIAHRERPNGASGDADVEDKHSAEAEDDEQAEADEEYSAEAEEDEQAEVDGEESAEADDDQAEAEEDEQAEADGEESAEADDEESAEREAAVSAFEDEMHELQADFGEDWILRFSVQGDDAWLTAEKDDGSQRVEAPTAEVLIEAVELLNEAGGRST